MDPPAVIPAPVSLEGNLIVRVVPVGVVNTSNFCFSKLPAVILVPQPGIVTDVNIITIPSSKLCALLKFKVASSELLVVVIVTPD